MAKQQEEVKYSDMVSTIVEEKYYFKDAYDWYAVKYLYPEVDRTYFILLAVISFVCMINVYFTVKNILPLKESFPILVYNNKIQHVTVAKPIKDERLSYDTNESLARFMLLNYVRELFNHNYYKNGLDTLNQKLEKIKLYSYPDVYSRVKVYIDGIAEGYFGQQKSQTVRIKTFKFVTNKKAKQTQLEKMQSYLVKTMPTEAQITYTLSNSDNGTITTTDGVINLSFKFNKVAYNENKKEFEPLVFLVTDYKITGK